MKGGKKFLLLSLFLGFYFSSNLFCTDFLDSLSWTRSNTTTINSVSWSSDGRYLAVGTDTSAGPEVVAYEFDGSNLTDIAGAIKEIGGNVNSVSWSPDGRYLAVGTQNSGNEEVFVYEFDGLNLNDIVAKEIGNHTYFVSWSPDGRYLAVASHFGASGQFVVYGFDGSNLTDIAGATKVVGSVVSSVSWSQDGRYLAVGAGINAGAEVLVYGFDGSNLTDIAGATKETNISVNSVSWSSDGRYLAVGTDASDEAEVLVYGFDGLNLNDITGATKEIGANVNSVSWSPDGRYLAIGTETSGNEEVLVYEFDGLNLNDITGATKEIGANVNSVSWSPYGGYLVIGGARAKRQLTVYRRYGLIDGVRNNLSYNNPFTVIDFGMSIGNVVFNNGIDVAASKTLEVGAGTYLSGTINLSDSGILYLGGNVHLGSEITGGLIAGNGYSLVLEDNGTISNDSVLHISADTVINGGGNDIDIGTWSQIFVDTDITLTLKNLTLRNTRNNQGFPPVRLAAHGSKLALDNVRIAPNCDFYFPEGQLYIYNDVSFTGTHKFFYQSTQPSRIMSQATWSFEPETEFYYDTASSYSTDVNLPSSTLEKPLHNELMIMEDDTAAFYFNRCTLQMSHTGLRLTKGRMFLDDQVIIKNDETYTFSYLTIQTSADYGDCAYFLEWSPDGRYLAVAGDNGSQDLMVFGWDGSSLTPLATEDAASWFNDASWSPDGKYLAVVGNNGTDDLIVYGWDGSSLTSLATVNASNGFEGVGWSPDGKYLAVAGNNGTDDLIVYGWDGSTLTSLATENASDSFNRVDWSPDGKYLAVAGNNGTDDLIVYGWDGSSLTSLATANANTNFHSVNWSPDGRYLAVVGNNGTDDLIVYEWNGSSLTSLATANASTNFYGINWSSDGKYLAVAGNNGTDDLIVYRLDGSNLIRKDVKDFSAEVRGVVWSPDQQYLAVGAENGSQDLIVYNVNYLTESYIPSQDNGCIFGDSSKGAAYDLDIYILPGATIDAHGMLAYDNVS